MNKFLLLAFITIFTFNSYGQTRYEKGYFISNDGTKTDCFIRNSDWKNNPTSFKYKLSLDSESLDNSIANVSEFVITDKTKYQRFTVKMGRSSDKLSFLDGKMNPDFKKETLFLKVLVTGEANLYSYKESNLVRFFYEIKEVEINQLVYKMYLKGSEVTKNDEYKRTLWTNVRCDKTKYEELSNLEYKRNDLIKYFEKYNSCVDPNYIIVKRKENKGGLNISIRPGVSFASFKASNPEAGFEEFDFGRKLGPRIGLEVEYIFPFKNNRWSLIFEPTFQSYHSDELDSEREVEASYSSIEIPIGVRRYFFLNDKSALFANLGGVTLDFNLNSDILEFKNNRSNNVESVKSADVWNNLFFGFGYRYKNKYSVEARYGFNRDLFKRYTFWSSNYSSFSIAFGYTIF
ncbi:tRNA modification GTPase [uncultured Aquimarina sp.]|uniref:tRNA modification GTPase n=1 Tax=uncultured Aquimarina sp. TaxID=575652 RepID=UPI00261BC3DC|nr:tRNA modification GTPase [uncultured Aquimarina sp.]